MSNEFDTVKSKANQFPYPIASILTLYRQINTDKLNERHSVLGDIFESLVKYLAVVLVKEASADKTNVVKVFPDGFDFLIHPSLGHWVKIVRDLSLIKTDQHLTWLPKIKEWFHDIKITNEIRDSYKNLDEIQLSGKSAVSGICNSLVTYRNKIWKGHGAASLPENVIEKRIPALENLLGFIINRAEFLLKMQLFYVKEVKILTKGTYEASSIHLLGTDKEHRNYRYAYSKDSDQRSQVSPFSQGEIYLTGSDEPELETVPLLVSPLVEWQHNARGDEQFYFFNDAQKKKLEYLCYVDGSYYYHREIKEELNKIFAISLDDTYEDESFEYLSEDERREKGEEFFHNGEILASQRQWGDSIAAYEDAIELIRLPKYIIAKCRAMIEEMEDNEYILSTLHSVYNFERVDAETLTQVRGIEKQIEEISEKESGKIKEIFDPAKVGYCYFDFFIPKKFKNYAPYIINAIILLFFGGLAGINYLFNPAETIDYLPVIIILIVQSVTMISVIMVRKKHYKDMYAPLRGQLDHTKESKFNSTYLKQYRNIFGYFLEHENGKVSIDFKKERYFLIPAGLFVLAFSSQNIGIQRLFEFSLISAVVHFVFTAAIWLIMTPPIRFVIMSTTLIREYSELSLTPLLGRTRISGFHKTAELYMQNLVFLLVFWVLNWSWNALVAKDPRYMDFVGLAFALGVVVFWIILTPKYIKGALNYSKVAAIMTYQNHIKLAFKKFIRTPNETNLKDLEWLQAQEKILGSISRRLFNTKQKFMLIFTNIMIFTASALYVIYRLDYFDECWRFIVNSVKIF